MTTPRLGQAERADRWAARVTARFWSKVNKTETCWLWTGNMCPRGYGRFPVGQKVFQAHRWAYEQLVGPIPAGLVADHLCRVRNCVNPEHLEPVTNAENILRGMSPAARSARSTYCLHGHEYTPENTAVRSRRGRPWRKCRTCERQLDRAATLRALGSAGGDGEGP